MLFLELALVRWLGSNIVHLSYFTNFVLLGSFLGIGLGFLLSRGERTCLPWSPVVLALLVAAVYVAPVQIDQIGSCRSASSATPTGPTQTRGSRPTSTTDGPFSAGPANATTSCSSPFPTAWRW